MSKKTHVTSRLKNMTLPASRSPCPTIPHISPSFTNTIIVMRRALTFKLH